MYNKLSFEASHGIEDVFNVNYVMPFVKKKIFGKIFCGNTNSQLFSCGFNHDISDDPANTAAAKSPAVQNPLLLLAYVRLWL